MGKDDDAESWETNCLFAHSIAHRLQNFSRRVERDRWEVGLTWADPCGRAFKQRSSHHGI